MTSENKPKTIDGGCLCGAVRYEIHFAGDYQWPPKSSICQCTMCRKWTSSILPQILSFQVEQMTPQLQLFPSTFAEYTEYESSPRRFRGFCSRCGSSILWRSEDDKDEFDLFLGTVDERWLIGEKGHDGRRIGGFGKELVTPNYKQLWCENEIPGCSDLLKGGVRYWNEDKHGEKPIE